MAGRAPNTSNTVALAVTLTLLLSALIAGCARTPADNTAAVPPPEDPGAMTEATAEQPEGEQVAADDAAADEVEAAPTEADDQTADATDGEQTEGVSGRVADTDKTVVKIKTNKGEMLAELYDEKMPITAGSFLLLIDDGFYNGLTFHRVVPDFVIQGGDPNGNGTGGPGFCIPLESPGKVHHERGILSMARAQPLDSAGSQFFVCLSNNDNVQSLDTLMGGYAAFGKVTSGMDVADTIRVGDKIESITIVSESPHAEAAREAAKKARIM